MDKFVIHIFIAASIINHVIDELDRKASLFEKYFIKFYFSTIYQYIEKNGVRIKTDSNSA